MWAPERIDRPIDVDILLEGGLDDHLGRLVEAGVDHLHAGVAQGPGDYLGAPVVAVQAGLGHQHADRSLHCNLLLCARRCDAPDYTTKGYVRWRPGGRATS